MSKKSSTTIIDAPILTISGGEELKVLEGAHLRSGGHFYATDSSIFGPNVHAARHVFIQLESGGIVEKSFVISNGTSISSARINTVEPVGIFATVHPMYRTDKKVAETGYYLPVGSTIAADATTPASNDDPDAPPVVVTIITVAGGKKGKLRRDMKVVAVGPKAKQEGYAEIDEQA